MPHARLNRPRLALLAAALLALPTGAARAEEMVANPAYQSWSAHGVGTKVVYTSVNDMGGMQMTMERTEVLASKDADKVVLDTSTTMNMPGMPPGMAKPHTQKVTHPAKIAKGQENTGSLPPGSTAEAKVVGNEKVEIAGKTYDCQVVEFKGKTPQGETAGKIWNADPIPGRMAKMTMTGQAQGQTMNMTMTLKAVEAK